MLSPTYDSLWVHLVKEIYNAWVGVLLMCLGVVV